MTTFEHSPKQGSTPPYLRYAQIVFVLFASYFLLGALVNSVGTVILQAIKTFGVTKKEASLLEAFKDPPIAIMSLLVAAWLPRSC